MFRFLRESRAVQNISRHQPVTPHIKNFFIMLIGWTEEGKIFFQVEMKNSLYYNKKLNHRKELGKYRKNVQKKIKTG